jgi:hypothetical protein
VLVGGDVLHADLVAARHGGQAAGIFVLTVVDVFIVDAQEAIELHNRAGGAEAE